MLHGRRGACPQAGTFDTSEWVFNQRCLVLFVTSWDDGHPLDERIAELLTCFGLKGTFFVPDHNQESRPILTVERLRNLDQQFEIGSHTLDHVYLTGLSATNLHHQVAGGKSALEQIVGHRVDGFCYPGGKLNAQVRRVVKGAGFKYARTIENLRLDSGRDLYAIPTTLQFYPHPRFVLFGNFLRHGRPLQKIATLLLATSGSDYWASLSRLLQSLAPTDCVVHIWGHSWEIEEHGLWSHLKHFLALVAETKPHACTISDLLNENGD
jgi:peptidoglycan/xylan/chitin deacetylase (PgdA/CDA1 family)